LDRIVGAGCLFCFFNFIGTTASGWLADKFDNRLLLFTYFGLRGLSLLYLPFSFTDFYTLSLFTVFYGLDWFATVAPTIRLVTNAVCRERGSIVYGWVFTCHQIGGASAAFFGGLFRTEFGSYMEVFMLSGLLCLVAAIAALFIGRNANPRDHEVAAAA
jgi:predicted MFS family arabinose efflux permease